MTVDTRLTLLYNFYIYIQSFLNELNEYERGKFGYTTGLTFSWLISRRFTLETGAWFSNKGYSMRFADFVNSTSEVLPYEKGNLRYIYGYIDIPLKLNVNIITKPVKVFVSAGMTADFCLYAKYRFLLVPKGGGKENYYVNMDDKGRTFNLSAMGSAGIEYEFLKHFCFRFEPMFMMNVMPVNLYDGEFKVYLWSLGGNAGIFYLFK
ncbi:MAG: outer membrane beta-barrel protein [Bacteroidota bacterium]|jgi:Outer membrane protein beta-barrel domain